ncbi:glycosyltransferase, partial [Candidatus Pacearchaeota archaeon]|nr:glycosyltransferase [Candidatus Pacearchaeota archaeon]
HTGLPDSLNVGLKSCRGKWIARLDADDIALPERLSTQLNFVNINKDTTLLGSGCILVNDIGDNIRQCSYPCRHEILMKRLETGKAFFPHSSAFFRREKVVELGGYNPLFKRSQDLDLWLRIGESARIACIERPLIKLRKHENMISNIGQGKLQMIMGLSARVCHVRRKLGLTDPSCQSEQTWRKFTEWLDQQGERNGFWLYMRTIQALSELLHNSQQQGRSKQIGKLFAEFRDVLLPVKALRILFGNSSLPLSLAGKYEEVLNKQFNSNDL